METLGYVWLICAFGIAFAGVLAILGDLLRSGGGEREGDEQ